MKRFSKKISFAFALAMSLVIGNSTVQTFGNDSSNIVEINIVSINDFHGALVSSGPNDLNLGAPRLVQAVLDKVDSTPNTIVVAAGDMYFGTVLSNTFYGEPVSYMLNLMGITASAVGNHEFTWGVDQIPIWSEIEGAPFVTANIFERSTGARVDWAIPYIIKEIEGVNLGILGLTTNTDNAQTAHLEFRNPVEIAEMYVPILREQGADIVLLLTHLGSMQDSETGVITLEHDAVGLTLVEGIDAIITSHYHRAVAGELDGVPVVQALSDGRAFSVVNFVFNTYSNELLDASVSIDLLHERRQYIEENQEMIEILSRFELAPDEIIGETVFGIYHHSREELTVLGQWVSSLVQEETGADVAFTNAAGFRGSIQAGSVTRSDVFEALPFHNSIVVFEMTGSQIKDVFEHGIEGHDGMLQFAGIVVEHVPGADYGYKVQNMTFMNGEPVELHETYIVATSSFMAAGGNGFTMFADANLLTDDGSIRDLMEIAIEEAGIIEFVAPQVLIPVAAETPAVEYIALVVEYVVPATEYVTPAPVVEYVMPTPAVEYVTPTVVAAMPVVHLVQVGDTLFRIALNNNTTVASLASLNNISNPNRIFVGQTIILNSSN